MADQNNDEVNVEEYLEIFRKEAIQIIYQRSANILEQLNLFIKGIDSYKKPFPTEDAEKLQMNIMNLYGDIHEYMSHFTDTVEEE